MPNSRRFHLAGIPQHVVQRGNARQACFRAEDDRLEYLHRLTGAARKHGVAIHAYVLMTNHVHLLATPEEPLGISRMMQAVGATYVRAFNNRYERTGTLWDGRFYSSLVDSESYLWKCHHYIETNPIRAGLVVEPSGYRWSSFRRNALGEHDPAVTPHPMYEALATGDPRRAERYRDMFIEAISEPQLETIRTHLRKERALGTEAFHLKIQALSARHSKCRRKGRPRLHALAASEN